MTIYEIMEQIEKLCHDNNFSMIFTIEDHNKGGATHICSNISDKAIIETIFQISEVTQERVNAMIELEKKAKLN